MSLLIKNNIIKKMKCRNREIDYPLNCRPIAPIVPVCIFVAHFEAKVSDIHFIYAATFGLKVMGVQSSPYQALPAGAKA